MCTLATDRLILRRFRPDDWHDLYQYLSDELVVRYEPYDTYTEAAAQAEAADRAQSEAFWAACLKVSGKLIGNVYFQRQRPAEFDTWEIGYVFNRSYWGQGYATESCRRMIDRAFSELNAHRVVALCNPENDHSWRLLERLGMRREGHLRRNVYFKRDSQGRPNWTDTYEYAILSEEWRADQSDVKRRTPYPE